MTPFPLDLNRSTFSSLKKQFDGVSGVYLLRCIDGHSYVGATSNLAGRAHAHQRVLKGKDTASWHTRWKQITYAMASQQPPDDPGQRKVLRDLRYRRRRRFDLQKEGGPPSFFWEMFLLEQTPPDPDVLGEREKFWCWALYPSLNSMRASYPNPVKNQGVFY
jgi:hypothetical protein